MIVIGARQGWRVADELAAAEIPVVISPLENLPRTFDALGATLENAAKLSEAGVTVAFYNENVSVTHDLKSLRHVAGVAVANGMAYDAALEALTAAPAEIWGLGEGVGALDVGAPANLVVWSGDPFEFTTHAEHVFIDGRSVSLQTRQTLLRDRYTDLERGELPFAYRGAASDDIVADDVDGDTAPEEAPPAPAASDGAPPAPEPAPTVVPEETPDVDAAPAADEDAQAPVVEPVVEESAAPPDEEAAPA
ncbi:MAG: amidohydrolase family protein, partial [Pseudomonadota bacterium]